MSDGNSRVGLRLRHLRLGWWSLLAFLLLGIGLETLHALKLEIYLAPANETRRLLWTLAHAHGTLLAILNLVFGLFVGSLEGKGAATLARSSQCLLWATGLLPLGFFLGGVVIYEGDPGLGVLLVPVGGVLLSVAVLLAARATH